jgi:hypothetical protein
VKSKQIGGSTTEWLIITVIFTLALFVPFDGERSALGMVVDAVKEYNENSSFIISLP